jgi:hypothetical protein
MISPPFPGGNPSAFEHVYGPVGNGVRVDVGTRVTKAVGVVGIVGAIVLRGVDVVEISTH